MPSPLCREIRDYAESTTVPPLCLGDAEPARPKTKPGLRGCSDARTGMPLGIPGGAMCVQRFDDSLNSAIHITYRISLRSSSMPEPRDPLLKVLLIKCFSDCTNCTSWGFSGGHSPAGAGRSSPARQSNKISSHGWRVSRAGQASCVASRSVMILPQVHLRKPCYDFYFL